MNQGKPTMIQHCRASVRYLDCSATRTVVRKNGSWRSPGVTLSLQYVSYEYVHPFAQREAKRLRVRRYYLYNVPEGIFDRCVMYYLHAGLNISAIKTKIVMFTWNRKWSLRPILIEVCGETIELSNEVKLL